MGRKTSAAGIRFIQNYEKCRLTAYKAVKTEKFWTIGWGHYGPDVTEGMTITQAKADSMFVEDLAKYEGYVNSQKNVPLTEQLTQNQFNALVSFTYNCGVGSLQKLCKGRSLAQIAHAMLQYNKSGGVILKGLVKRRAAEVEIFNREDEIDMEALKKLEDRLEQLEQRNSELESQLQEMREAQAQQPPVWAKATVDKLLKTPAKNGTGMILTDATGDYSFHRTLTVLDRAGAFSK